MEAVDRLVAEGMSLVEAKAKERLLTNCSRHVHEPAVSFFVPGRIEVLGKHTDYAGGRSLLCTMERGFVMMSAPRADTVVRVTNAMTDETRELRIGAEQRGERGHWSAYFAAVAQRLASDFPHAGRGANIAFASDLPAASGMSSSSALVISAFLALSDANDLEQDATFTRVITSREVLGNYLGAVENGRSFGGFAAAAGVGTLGGSQDQTAILCCRAGMLSQYSFCPVRAEGEYPFPRDRVFVVAFSGVAAEKTSSAMLRYNEASLSVSEIVRLSNEATGRCDESLAAVIANSQNVRDTITKSVPTAFTIQRLLDRYDQFAAESNDIIPATARAFARGDLAAVGALVDRSQRGAEQRLGNQIPETIALARMARELGADAASAFGAGFGGSVWALVTTAAAEQFTQRWHDVYASAFPVAAAKAEFIVTRPGPPALRLA
ncbi:MAG: galactokinase [Gemmatimonadetes bacterium]|nr:galactokinase [Gemmatimonadota bacterium]